jgi:hypothetical protein
MRQSSAGKEPQRCPDDLNNGFLFRIVISLVLIRLRAKPYRSLQIVSQTGDGRAINEYKMRKNLCDSWAIHSC